jgi:hypothetical protein
MASILTKLPKIISKAVGPLFYDAVLTRLVETTTSPDRDSWNPAAPTEVTYTCKALFEEYESRLRLDGKVKENERKTLVLAHTLSVTPIPGDKITITALGESSLCLIVNVDPARACWELHSVRNVQSDT